MKRFSQALTIDQIRKITGAEYQGKDTLVLDSVTEPGEAGAGSIIFWEQEQLYEAVQRSSAGLVICAADRADRLAGRNLLLTPRPYFTLMSLVSWWLEQSVVKPSPGVHTLAVVDPSATIGAGTYIGAHCSIGPNARIGANCIIGENCHIGANAKVGDKTRLYPHVVVYEDCELGSDDIIHSGAIIGADGFGFILLEGKQHKIPQIGNVVIGNYVEIGANSTIDRATLGSTVIGDGTKIDNLVQIGHNCQIGKHCILCAQVGLAGSTTLGDYVYLAGQVGAAGHHKIGDRAMVGAQSGIAGDVPADGRYIGTPAEEANLMKRIFASQKHLPQIYRQYLKQIKDEAKKGE